MPSWGIHLKVANDLNKELKLDKDLFTFGNLIPDVDKDCKITRFQAHYYGNLVFPKCPKENMIDLSAFIKDYKNKISEDLIIGYYCHLLTDNFYNEYIYYNKWVQDKENNIIGIKDIHNKIIDISSDFKLTGKYKHTDLELYAKYLLAQEKLYIPKDKKIINSKINILKNKFYTENNVNNRIDYLNNDYNNFVKLKFKEKLFKHKYKLFTKKELDNLYEDCIRYIKSELKKVGILNEEK